MERLDARSVASIVSRLAQEKGFLETVFDALDEGVVVLNPERRAIYLNRSARTQLGLPADFTIGDSLIRHLPSTFWKALDEDIKSGKLGSALHHEVEISYPEARFLQIYVGRLHEDNIPETDALLILRDVTESRRRAARHAESERLDAVTHLAAGVAHEIGNPLNSLHIYMQLMEREIQKLKGRSKTKLVDQIKVCSREIARLDQIVNQFLKAVRPTHPALAPEPLHDILDEVLKVLKPEIANRDVLLELEYARHLPLILADRNQMKQVFFNLIRNSLQAMGKGGILLIRTQLESERVMLTLRDSGKGISSKTLQHIFKPYFTTKSEGTGLGLMIVERVIREHGGLIEVSSEQGRGTIFRIFLPIAEKQARLLENNPVSPTS